MTTIIFEGIELSTLNVKKSKKLRKSLLGKKFFDKKNDKIIMTSEKLNKEDNQLICPPFGNGLLGSIYLAYSCHIPLILRPDDIWLGIIISFGNYVKNHSEEMRHLFVDHEGKKQLEVKVESPYLEFTSSEHWEEFVGLMTLEIEKNVKGDIVNWIVPCFSTTTPTDVTVSQIALMGTVNEYFDMKFTLGCGLSKLMLEGTLDDWKQLYENAKKLYDFGIKDLSNWADLLLPVLEQFINAYQRNIDNDFWQRICTYTTRGSGSQQNFRGWFLVFSPFSDKGKYLLRPFDDVKKDNIYGVVADDDIVDCGINTSCTIDDHGNTCQIMFYAGLLMTKYENCSVAPKSAWIMVVKKNITYKDLLDELEKNFSKNRAKISHERCEYQKELLKIAYYIAEKSFFPNDTLMDLVEKCEKYECHFRDKEKQPVTNKLVKWLMTKVNFEYESSQPNINKFVTWLAEKEHFGYIPNIFAKYIDPNRIDELCNTYETK
jgi:hypothetical protein